MSALFKDKVVIVTGAGGAIGRAAALGFAKEGAQVTVSDIDDASAIETVTLIERLGGQAIKIVADVSKAEQVADMVEQTVQRFGGLDCAFNNAGITHPDDAKWDEAIFRKLLDVNLVSQMLCMQYEIPHMLQRGKGAIVNTSSIMGLIGQVEPVQHGYTASKHAVIGLTKAVALQYAKDNIRVNAICPGVTRSAMVEAAMASSKEFSEKLSTFAPLKGVAEPEEIAEVAIWLCSDKSSFVTAHALVADGGYTSQ